MQSRDGHWPAAGARRRLGHFSTGTAFERVTEWTPDEKLAFTVEKNIPAMRAVSPYEHVHAPHVIGFFDTSLTSFGITPLPGARSRFTLTSKHELRPEPNLYWRPMARCG